MLFPKLYFFQSNKNAFCNNSNILQDDSVSVEMSYCEDINVHFLLCDRFGFSFVGILSPEYMVLLYCFILLSPSVRVCPAPVGWEGCFCVDNTDPLLISN